MNGDVESTEASANTPRHVAIIMDGNGRWASRRRLPRFAGHKAGVETVKGVVRACGEKGVEVLTLFGFASANWRRDASETPRVWTMRLSSPRRATWRVAPCTGNFVSILTRAFRSASGSSRCSGSTEGDARSGRRIGPRLRSGIR